MDTKIKPKLLFVFDHPNEIWWLDGLSAALGILEEDFDITRVNVAQGNAYVDFDMQAYDFTLGWGAFGSKVDKRIQERSGKSGLCIGGNATLPEGANNYDILFYETKWYRQFINFHLNIVHAFGANTDIYSPTNIPTPIVWDYVGVGSLASWKRWDKMIDKAKQGYKCLVVGQYQKDNESESLEIARNLIKNNVMVSNEVHPLDLANIYQWSRKLYMPSDINGGGERAILEARSCGIGVEIESDNPKLQELIEMNPIPSHIEYAKKLKDAILSVI